MNKRDEAVLDFREKFPVHLKAGDGRMLWVRRDEVESWLLQKLQEERAAFLNLPCMQDEQLEKEATDVLLASRNYLRREIREALNHQK